MIKQIFNKLKELMKSSPVKELTPLEKALKRIYDRWHNPELRRELVVHSDGYGHSWVTLEEKKRK